jgi:ribosomal protein L16 Arg81 hydroxylase
MVGIDLRGILRPHSPEGFVQRYWTKRTLYIRGTSSKFRALGFGQSALAGLAAGTVTPEIIAQHHDVAGLPRGVVIEAPQAEPLYRAGMTICFQSLDQLHPALARAAAAIKLGLNYPDRVAVNANWSPDGAGYGLHFDCHQTFVLQLEGAKRWRFASAPLVPFPPRSLSFGDPESVRAFRRDYPWARLARPDETRMIERVLRPGDVLYLPAGTVHRTSARGSSLSLTVSCWRTSMLDLLWQDLTSRLGGREDWRQPVPVFTPSGSGRTAFPPATADFLAERLGDLRRIVNGWTPADLAPTFFSSVSDGLMPTTPTDSPGPVRRGDRFDVPAPVVCVPAAGADGRLHVFTAGIRLSMPLTAGPFLRRLARRRRFQAVEATRWSGSRSRLPWPEVREALAVLLRRGLIRRTEREDVRRASARSSDRETTRRT